jgi:hypothetical protein
MAKSSVPGLDRIRELFTSAERAVLESTVGKSLADASRKQLDATLARARSLRDKWRDLHATQSRVTKRAAGGSAAANARSREKSDVFTAAIDRIQSQLAALGPAPGGTRSTGKAPMKAARRAGHRTTRAGVKGALAATTADLNRGRAKPVAPRAVAKPAAVTARPAAPAVKPIASKKRRPAKKAASVLAKGGGQPVRFDVAKQRAAKASATAARLTLDGAVNRRGRHVQAVGKRRQAARDRRGR